MRSKALPYIFTVLTVLAVFGGVYVWGRDDGNNQAERTQLKAVVESQKQHDIKTKEVVTLPDDALRKRYCKWMRDSEELCLQSDIPIRE